MNVYDFDRTIYGGDSAVDFYFFELRRHPSIIKYFPAHFAAFYGYLRKKIEKVEMKQIFFSFVESIDTEKEVRLFWNKKKKKIYRWYIEQKKPTDVVISASPDFLLKVITDDLGVNLIASRISPKNGKFDGKNCVGDEKVARFREIYGNVEIDEFYSDSFVDLPLAKIARRSFRIVRGKIRDNGFGLN